MLVERHAKCETLLWNDFSSAGFTRSNAPLSATLQFSPPLTPRVCFSNLEYLAQSALTNQLEELKVARVWRRWVPFGPSARNQIEITHSVLHKQHLDMDVPVYNLVPVRQQPEGRKQFRLTVTRMS
jgi:hypothetical protein